MSYFNELEEIYEQTKTALGIWKEVRRVSPDELRKQDRDIREYNKKRAIKYKGECCGNCGLKYHHAAMEFHHYIGTKESNISSLMTSSWDKIKKELNKCTLLCSNCHAIEHWEENHPGMGRYGPIKDKLE